MADLDPALIGLGGVIVGAAITQIADSIRWSRVRRSDALQRRQGALIEFLGCVSDVAESALNLIPHNPDQFARATHVAYDYKPLDRNTASLERSALALRVLAGDLDAEIRAIQSDARAVADAAFDIASGGAPEVLETRAATLDEAVTTLLDTARRRGLLTEE